MSHSRSENPWRQLGWNLLKNAAFHPLEYAKVLIQIGYEPLPPYPSKTLLGKPALYLPNVFQYMVYVKKADGFAGCFRGLTPKLCGNALSAIAFAKVENFLRPEGEDDDDEKEGTFEEKRWRCITKLIREGTARSLSIIISQPFRVIAIRMMAQFVGGEPKYVSLFGSIRSIYRENGVFGFFSGLIPAILGELTSLTISTSLIFIINNYMVMDDLEVKRYVATSVCYLASNVAHPFQVVSTCMAVTGSGIPAGHHPNMPLYTSWVDCWSHLKSTNQLKRGSSLVWRYYGPPARTVPIYKKGALAGGSKRTL